MKEFRYSPILDRRITVENTPTIPGATDAWGAPELGITERFELWASRHDTSAGEGELQTNQARTSTVRTTFTIRWRSDDVRNWTIIADGQRYRVLGVREMGRRRWLRLDCVSVEVTR